MMRKAIILTALFAGMLAATQTLAAGDDKTMPPDQVIKQTAEKVLGTIRDNKQKFRNNPQAVFDLVQQDMAPHFDFEYAARLVLGRAWRTASPEQRKTFIDAFMHYLVNSYANGLVKYADSKIEVEPFRGRPSDERATIRTLVTPPNRKPIHVDYAMRRTDDGWKAFDVSGEGVSYVMSYRNTFASEIRQTGLDALIKRLQQKAEQKADEATRKASGSGGGDSGGSGAVSR